MYQDLLDRLRLKVEETQMVTVFLSSPFAGMEKERQLFIEQYLPILREMCDAHAVFLKVCDLRWGISAKQTELNETLLICLREISDADIFVGVYGRRYGSYYIPDDASTEWVLHSFDRAADHFPWVQQYRDRAITEVEFRHGFMRDPGTKPAIVLFRSFEYDEAMVQSNISDKEKRKYSRPREDALKKLNGMLYLHEFEMS
eukprot:gene6346-9273_t